MNTKLFSLLLAIFFIFGTVNNAAAYTMVQAAGEQPVAAGLVRGLTRAAKKGAKVRKAKRSGYSQYAAGAVAGGYISGRAAENYEESDTTDEEAEPEDPAAFTRNVIIGILVFFGLILAKMVYNHFIVERKQKAQAKEIQEEMMRRAIRPRAGLGKADSAETGAV